MEYKTSKCEECGKKAKVNDIGICKRCFDRHEAALARAIESAAFFSEGGR